MSSSYLLESRANAFESQYRQSVSKRNTPWLRCIEIKMHLPWWWNWLNIRRYDFSHENIKDLNSASLVSAGYTRHQSCSRIVILQSIDNAVDPVETRLTKG